MKDVANRQLRTERLVSEISRDFQERNERDMREEKKKLVKNDKSKAAAFLIENTVNHVPIVDPTGNSGALNYPSKLAIFPDREKIKTMLLGLPQYVPPIKVSEPGNFSHVSKISKFEK